MKIGKLAGAVGAIALIASPVIANGTSAKALSPTSATSAVALQDGDEGSGPGILGAAVGLGVAAILVLGLTLGDDDGDDLPASP